MGKKQAKEQRKDQKPTQIIEKKPMREYLPYNKYQHLKGVEIRKKRNQAIQTISLDKFQIKKALQHLLKFAEQNKNPADLFGDQGFVYLEIDMARIPQEQSIRPIQIQLPHPIYSSELKSRYTIIVSDPEEEFTDKLSDLNVPMVQEVIGYEKMKKNFKQKKDKNSLLAANDLFFCDWKIYNLLRQPLGKEFYSRKKYPYPIDCSGEVPQGVTCSYEEYINNLANSTYVMLGNGPVYSAKVGRTSMDIKQLVKNVMRGGYNLIAHILDNKMSAKNVRQISIKTYNSPSLPIYHNLTQQEISAYKSHKQ